MLFCSIFTLLPTIFFIVCAASGKENNAALLGANNQPADISDVIMMLGKWMSRMENTTNVLVNEVRILKQRVDRYQPAMTTAHPLSTRSASTTNRCPTTTPGIWVYYPPGTRQNRARRCYPNTGLRFVGLFTFWNFGSYPYMKKDASSWWECMQFCKENRPSGYRYCHYVYGYSLYDCYSFKHVVTRMPCKGCLMYKFD